MQVRIALCCFALLAGSGDAVGLKNAVSSGLASRIRGQASTFAAANLATGKGGGGSSAPPTSPPTPPTPPPVTSCLSSMACRTAKSNAMSRVGGATMSGDLDNMWGASNLEKEVNANRFSSVSSGLPKSCDSTQGTAARCNKNAERYSSKTYVTNKLTPFEVNLKKKSYTAEETPPPSETSAVASAAGAVETALAQLAQCEVPAPEEGALLTTCQKEKYALFESSRTTFNTNFAVLKSKTDATQKEIKDALDNCGWTGAGNGNGKPLAQVPASSATTCFDSILVPVA